MFRRSFLIASSLVLGAAASAPLLAQSSGTALGYQWVQAVKEEDGAKLNKIAADRSKLNSAVLDYQSDGEGAIHVAVRKGNGEYLRFMLGLRANPNLIAERDGETPLTQAALLNQPEMATILLNGGARVDQGNRSGETPLIKAVRFNRIDMVRQLLERGADADKADYTGKSARTYAAANTRFPAIAKALADAPKKSARPVAGPRLN
jgi:ankyrin repeat protein